MSEQADSQASGPKEISGRIGKYEVVRPLGKGAMGMVYLAKDTLLDREVALKVMMASIADDEELQKRFEREAKAVARMTHPNVVTIFDRGYHTDGSPYIAMELLKGDDLQKTVRKEEMSLDKKVAIIVQVLAGLSHAHAAGIVHRDIKPANIFIKSDGSVKIMDFGVARMTTASMTGTGAIVGTADYMSPEQVKGAKVDGRSDVFSVGCMLFELLAGHRPFKAENLMAIFYRITHEAPNWDSLPKGPEYDALMPILQKALAKDLDERYQSAQEFAVELRDYLKQHVTSATGRHALENLGDFEAPSGEASGEAETVVEAGDLDGLGGGSTLRGTAATVRGTAAGGATRPATSATVLDRPGTRPRTVATRVQPLPRAAPPAASSGNPVLYTILGIMGTLLLGFGGFIYWTQFREQPTPPTTIAASQPPETTLAAPPPTAAPAPPPTTAAPPPTVSAEGKAAATVRSAQSSFSKGDYDRAVSQAQEALRIDPSNAGARSVLDNALKGQQAKQRFVAAQAAMRANDFDKALKEAQAGSDLAPWDGQGPDLVTQVRAAQQRAAQQAAAQQAAALKAEMDGLLQRAETSLQAKQYAAAIAVYDQVLARDPGNARATQGRTAAVAAKAVADATVATPPAPTGHRFVLGKTIAEAKKQGAVPPGFQTTEGVNAQATQAAATPGRLEIRVRPDPVKAGEQFSVEIEMVNEGGAPILLKDMIVTTTVNGRRSQGPIQPQVKEVAPRQGAQLYQLGGNYWREDTEQWSMQVMVRTTDGSSYRNTLEWK